MLDTWGLVPRLDHRHHPAERDGLHRFFLPNAGRDGESEITIRLADSVEARSGASMLINRKYADRGYGNDHAAPIARNCATFNASSGNSVIGTLSLTVDSSEGLACDKTFKDEIDGFRSIAGVKVCELTRFAFDASTPSLHLLASLFHVIFIYGTHVYDCTDLFIEVHSRHRRFYETMLGFQPVGSVKVNSAVGVPSNLMWLKVSEIRRRIAEHAGSNGAAQRSLYPLFFSEEEEIGVCRRLLEEMPERPHATSTMNSARSHAGTPLRPSDRLYGSHRAMPERRGNVLQDMRSSASYFRRNLGQALAAPQTT